MKQCTRIHLSILFFLLMVIQTANASTLVIESPADYSHALEVSGQFNTLEKQIVLNIDKPVFQEINYIDSIKIYAGYGSQSVPDGQLHVRIYKKFLLNGAWIYVLATYANIPAVGSGDYVHLYPINLDSNLYLSGFWDSPDGLAVAFWADNTNGTWYMWGDDTTGIYFYDLQHSPSSSGYIYYLTSSPEITYINGSWPVASNGTYSGYWIVQYLPIKAYGDWIVQPYPHPVPSVTGTGTAPAPGSTPTTPEGCSWSDFVAGLCSNNGTGMPSPNPNSSQQNWTPNFSSPTKLCPECPANGTGAASVLVPGGEIITGIMQKKGYCNTFGCQYEDFIMALYDITIFMFVLSLTFVGYKMYLIYKPKSPGEKRWK